MSEFDSFSQFHENSRRRAQSVRAPCVRSRSSAGALGHPRLRHQRSAGPRRAAGLPQAARALGESPPCRVQERRRGDAAPLRAKGEITPEMEFISVREGLPVEFVRDEVARGRANHPVQHQPFSSSSR